MRGVEKDCFEQGMLCDEEEREADRSTNGEHFRVVEEERVCEGFCVANHEPADEISEVQSGDICPS